MVRTQIQLTEQQAARLKRLARKEGISMAEVIRRAVDRVLAAGAVPSETELRHRAHSLVGAFTADRGDVADRHDDYLSEGFLE